MRSYLDHNATSPLRPEVREATVAALDLAGNPSSVHEEGRRARAAVERARAQVAELAGCRPGEIVFTSGASEANTTVMSAGWDLVVASAMEHESVLAAGRRAEEAGAGRCVEIPAFADGQVEVGQFGPVKASFERIGQATTKALVAVQLANGETGVIQPLDRAVEVAREHGMLVHSDAVQAAGRVPLNFAGRNLDFMSLSAHKIGGPKGVGALVVRDGLDIAPLVHGGGQESRRRAGTENVAAIVGFGAAAECALRDLGDMDRIAALRDRLERQAEALSEDVNVFSASRDRLANTSAIALVGARAETLVIQFDLAGVAVSAGSACSSGKASPSHVLRAMPHPAELVEGTFRVSLGWSTTEDDIDRFLDAFAGIVRNRGTRTAAPAAQAG